MHVKRIITSLIAFPLLSLLILKGSALLFSSFIAVVSLFALYEYFQIVFSDKKSSVWSPISLWGGFCGLLIISSAYTVSFQLMLGAVVLNSVGASVLSMMRYKTDPGILKDVKREIQGVIYIPLSLAFIVLLRNDPHGVAWIFLLLFIVFAGDVGAFYAGKFFGRHKLSPSISPGKTIEGSIGGMILCVIVGYVFVRLFLPHLTHAIIFLLFVFINIIAQIGDLFESELKRTAGIKDSGNILPGHGGILDRIDALLFAAPVAYFFKALLLSGI
jgi:phosphatidate cytidylyltransferase